jgi:hypothetical protein
LHLHDHIIVEKYPDARQQIVTESAVRTLTRRLFSAEFRAMLGAMNARTPWVLVVIAACSSKPAALAPTGQGNGGGSSSAGHRGEDFMTLVYAPPTPAAVQCPGGVPTTLAPEWHSMKPDDGTSPGEVYVQLDATPQPCSVGVGKFPRVCKKSDGWTTTCTNHDGSRPHVGQLRCTPTTLEVWVVAPEGDFRIAELPRPAGSSPCKGT